MENMSTAEAVSLLTGLTIEELEELGGFDERYDCGFG